MASSSHPASSSSSSSSPQQFTTHSSSRSRPSSSLPSSLPMPSFSLLLFLPLAIFILSGCFIPSADAFILQELPLYRSIRDDHHDYAKPLAAAEDAHFFARPQRAFNFHRLNRLRNQWNRNEALKRMTESHWALADEEGNNLFWKK